MVLMWSLGVVVGLGFAAALVWGRHEIQVPWAGKAASTGEVLRRYVWFVGLAVCAGVASGLVMIGAGGRVAMRLLAVTSPEARGRVTEAGEIVGDITFDGTMGFIVFSGIIGGLITGLLYISIQRWLPPGRWSGVSYGAILLIVGATRIEPLRADNPDFDIVGPGWLSVLLFVMLGLGHGMLVAAISGWLSRRLPMLSGDRRTILPYLPLVLLIPGFPLLIGVGVGGVVALVVHNSPRVLSASQHPKMLTGGRVMLALGIAIALPGFVEGVADILGRA